MLVHPWYAIPSNEKGKTHFAPALPPPTVRHLPPPLEENPHCDWLRNPLRHALVSLSLPKHFLPWPNDSCNFFRVRVCSSIPLLHEHELHFPHWSHLQSDSPEKLYRNILNTKALLLDISPFTSFLLNQICLPICVNSFEIVPHAKTLE